MPQSLSVVNIHLVFAYQEELHRKMSYQDEVRALLRKHNQDWDEKYVWD